MASQSELEIRRLFVLGVDPRVHHDTIKFYFSQFGDVIDANNIGNHTAFVYCASLDEARRVENQTNGTYFQGRKLKVEYANVQGKCTEGFRKCEKLGPYRILHERDMMALSETSGPADNQIEISEEVQQTQASRRDHKSSHHHEQSAGTRSPAVSAAGDHMLQEDPGDKAAEKLVGAEHSVPGGVASLKNNINQDAQDALNGRMYDGRDSRISVDAGRPISSEGPPGRFGRGGGGGGGKGGGGYGGGRGRDGDRNGERDDDRYGGGRGRDGQQRQLQHLDSSLTRVPSVLSSSDERRKNEERRNGEGGSSSSHHGGVSSLIGQQQQHQLQQQQQRQQHSLSLLSLSQAKRRRKANIRSTDWSGKTKSPKDKPQYKSAEERLGKDKLTCILFKDAKGWKPGYHDDVNALLQEQQQKPYVDVPRGSIVLLDNPNNDFDPARAVNVSVVDQPGVKVTALLNQMHEVSEEIVNLLRPAKYETRYQLITDSRRAPSLSCRVGEMVFFTPPGETNLIQAVVRYMGPVHTLGPGTRIGLQIMDEDWHFGDTNGTLAGRVYFEADENKGVFCHVGQITRIQKNEELTKMSQFVSVERLANEFNSYDNNKDQGNKRHNLTLSNNRHKNNFAETTLEQDRQDRQAQNVRSTSSKTVDMLRDRRQRNMETLKNVIFEKRKATSSDAVSGTAKVIKPSTSKGFYLAPYIYNQLSDVEKQMSNVLCGTSKKRQVDESEERPDMARSFASRIISNGPVESKKLQVNKEVANLIMGCIPEIEFKTKTNISYIASAAFPNLMTVYIRGTEKDVKKARTMLEEESARLYTQ